MLTRFMGLFGPTLVFRPDEPAGGGGTGTQDPPKDDPPKPDPPKDDPPKPDNGAAAAERLRKKAEKERDDALAKLKEREDAELDDKTKAERAAQEAKDEAKKANERADKADVKSRLVLRVGAKTSATQAAIDLSEGKLLDLKDASDEELDAHLDDVVKRYSLPAPGEVKEKPDPTATPAGGPGRDETGALAPTPQAATGDPKKDYRTGIGVGILGMLRGERGNGGGGE